MNPAAVGNGADFVATTSQPISWAEGSFPRVTGVTDATTGWALQMNSQIGPAGYGLCSGAQTPSNCHPWQQFMFQNPWGFIQYWMTNYANTKTVNYGTCRSNPCSNGDYMCPQGWTADNLTNPGCMLNGNGYNINASPGIPMRNLGNMTLIANATSAGDSVFLSTGNGTLYTASDAGEKLGLSQWWTEAEFNIFGWSNGAQANLGSNAVVTVQLITDTSPASTPTVGPGGTTFETNNLTLVPNSQCAFGGSQPGIQFTEGYVGAPSPGCPYSKANPVPVAFQVNTHWLYLYNNGQTTNTWEGMMAGTVPSMVTPPNETLPIVAFQSNNGRLFLYDMNTGAATDTGLLMKAKTSPAMMLLNQYQTATNYVIVAYQGTGGRLQVYRSDTGANTITTLAMQGSPSIALAQNSAHYGDYMVAYNSSAYNNCWVYNVTTQGYSKCASNEPTMKAGTDPKIAAWPTGTDTYTTMFQGSNGDLYWYYPGGGGDTGLGMMPGTSPTITVLNNGPGAVGIVASAFQANTGYLYTSVNGVITNTQTLGFPKMAASASPTIVPTAAFGYQIAFEGIDTYLYVDHSGTLTNTLLGMDTP